MSTNARIFIVEDSLDTVLHLKIYLKKSFDCDLTVAHAGDEAIEILKRGVQFDLIICDFMMSPGSGLDVLHFLSDSGSQIPFILYSAQARDLQRHKSDICRAVIDKMKIEELVKTVGQLIGQKDRDW